MDICETCDVCFFVLCNCCIYDFFSFDDKLEVSDRDLAGLVDDDTVVPDTQMELKGVPETEMEELVVPETQTDITVVPETQLDVVMNPKDEVILQISHDTCLSIVILF